MPASFDPGFDQSMERLVRACDELARVQADTEAVVAATQRAQAQAASDATLRLSEKLPNHAILKKAPIPIFQAENDLRSSPKAWLMWYVTIR